MVQPEINPGGVRAVDKDCAGSVKVEKMNFWMLGKQRARQPGRACQPRFPVPACRPGDAALGLPNRRWLGLGRLPQAPAKQLLAAWVPPENISSRGLGRL